MTRDERIAADWRLLIVALRAIIHDPSAITTHDCGNEDCECPDCGKEIRCDFDGPMAEVAETAQRLNLADALVAPTFGIIKI